MFRTKWSRCTTAAAAGVCIAALVGLSARAGSDPGPGDCGSCDPPPSAWTPWTTMVSIDSNEVQGLGRSDLSAVSATGRYVAFFSVSDLAPGADGGVYVRDVSNGTTVWVSDPAQIGSPGRGSWPTISADGRFVAFGYSHNDPTWEDVYVHDRDADADGVFDESGATSVELVSVDAEDGHSWRPYISADAKYVAFTSEAHITAADADAGEADVYRRNLEANTTELVSVPGARGMEGSAWGTSISTTGQHVAFDGYGTNVAPGDMNGVGDVFVRDMNASTTTLVSTGAKGQADGPSSQGSLSGDGTLVAFTSTADNLGGDHYDGANMGGEDVYVRDLTYGTTQLVSTSTTGGGANGPSRYPALSADGSRVAFASEATNLVNNDTEGNPDVFVRALSRATHQDDEYVEHVIVLGKTVRVSVRGSIGGDRASGMGFSDKFYRAPGISSSGKLISFTSMASNLTSSDVNDKTTDVFLRYMGAA